ncbi:glycine/D-amino acid oxidase-like deaminating enzyme [Shimia isoporae]|uniref:Glycine/D-amino acid oxidase-like deaminating enzyme n=1 Tax=Shimia isoporae TaxID=647720 RepID=A0A4R1N8N1_9RHOB|nr:FAD-binding oxidoreductase [Shimia isoporae]TCL01464.1 glycine/D-amino acid oxidase-like deaminating enzyme [Shimia isoporae]
MTRICDPFSYGDGPVSESFWADSVPIPDRGTAAGAVEADVAIIGAGFTGLNAALRLAQAGMSVVILEAKQVGWGASGRNGGFCCLGGAMLDAAGMERTYGADATRAFFMAEKGAVEFVEQMIDESGWDVDRHSDGETILAHKPSAMRAIADEAAHIDSLFGTKSTVIPKEELRQHGLGGDFHGAATLPVGFALNPRKYVSALANSVEQSGATIFGDSPVTDAKRDNGKWSLKTPEGTVRAEKLVIATNGYSSEAIPAWMAGRYLPAQSSIIVTRPLTDDELRSQGWTSSQMAYDSRSLIHYFRLMPDRRFLFGMRGGITTSETVHHRIRHKIRAHFERLFPEWRHVETPWFHTGFVCLSRDLTPFAGAVPEEEGLYAAFAYHGNGVAMGSYAGALLAEDILGRSGLPHPDVLRRPPKPFPLGRFRRLLMYPAYVGFELSDL